MTTTPPPVYSTRSDDLHPPVTNAVKRMELHDKTRLRAYAYRAKALFPGAIGELVSRELLTIEEFGWALGAGSLGTQLMKAIDDASPKPGSPEPTTRPPRPPLIRVR